MTTQQAMRIAWVIWLVLLLIPFFVFLGVVSYITFGTPAGPTRIGQAMFVISLCWIAVSVPLAFFWRDRIFKSYWTGEVVPPRAYLRGMAVVWVTIEIGGLLSLAGCLVAHSLIPNIVPAMVAFVLFTPFWPSGHAMVRAVGTSDDNEIFEHPR